MLLPSLSNPVRELFTLDHLLEVLRTPKKVPNFGDARQSANNILEDGTIRSVNMFVNMRGNLWLITFMPRTYQTRFNFGQLKGA